MGEEPEREPAGSEVTAGRGKEKMKFYMHVHVHVSTFTTQLVLETCLCMKL